MHEFSVGQQLGVAEEVPAGSEKAVSPCIPSSSYRLVQYTGQLLQVLSPLLKLP